MVKGRKSTKKIMKPAEAVVEHADGSIDEEVIEKPKAKVKEKPNGVLFWHRAKTEGDPPRYWDDPSLAPPDARFGESHHLDIEWPKGSGNHLWIRGTKVIDDREVIIYLIMHSQSAVAGSKAGSILYNPDQVVSQGWLTKEELKEAQNGKHPDGVNAIGPMRPMPQFDIMPDFELSNHAISLSVNVDPTWSRFQKLNAIKKAWHQRQAERLAM